MNNNLWYRAMVKPGDLVKIRLYSRFGAVDRITAWNISRTRAIQVNVKITHLFIGFAERYLLSSMCVILHSDGLAVIPDDYIELVSRIESE